MARGKPGERMVAARPALYELTQMQGIKGFAVFTAYFALYFALQSVRVDTEWSRYTLKWYIDAQESSATVSALDDATCSSLDTGFSGDGRSCYWPYLELHNVDDVVEFVEHGLATVVSNVQRVCPGCDVGITSSSRDMERLNLTDFACADFDSIVGTNEYPSRDCARADAEWAAHPTVFDAPCCENPTLVRASIVMMARHRLNGTRSAQSVGELTGPNRSHIGSRHFVTQAIEDHNFVVQVVISRAQRMVGIEHHCRWVSKEWAPGRVATRTSFWSFRFDNRAQQRLLAALTAVAAAVSAAHEVVKLWTHHPTVASMARRLCEPYMLIFVIPSFVLPALAEVMAGTMSVSAWTLWAGLNELLMFVRCFHEGHVLAPFRVIVLTLSNAAGQLVSFSAVVFGAIVVIAAVSNQLFGVWSDDYGDLSEAVTRVFNQFTIGAEVDERALLFSPHAALLMHYVTNLFLFLIVSQFFIAIVVGSFDATRTIELEHTRDRMVPPGYVPASRPPGIVQQCARGLRYFVTYRVHGTWAPVLIRRLDAAIRRVDLVHGGEGEHPVMLSVDELIAAVGEPAARMLIKEYGVVRDMQLRSPDAAHVTSIIDAALRARRLSSPRATTGEFPPYGLEHRRAHARAFGARWGAGPSPPMTARSQPPWMGQPVATATTSHRRWNADHDAHAIELPSEARSPARQQPGAAAMPPASSSRSPSPGRPTREAADARRSPHAQPGASQSLATSPAPSSDVYFDSAADDDDNFYRRAARQPVDVSSPSSPPSMPSTSLPSSTATTESRSTPARPPVVIVVREETACSAEPAHHRDRQH